MKKYVLIYLAVFFTGLVLTGCVENDIFVPKSEASVFGFQSAAVALDEGELDKDFEVVAESNTLTITVVWHKNAATSASINLEVFPRTKVPAIEGEDYTISTKTLSFSEEEYTQSFTITSVYDPTFTGKKTFTVKILNTDVSDARVGAFGASDSCVVTINDVNHPLVALIGAAQLSYESYWGGVETYDVTISADADDPTVLWMPTNMVNATYNNPMKLVVETLDDSYEVTIRLPISLGKNAAGTQELFYYGVYLDEEEEVEVTDEDFDLIGTTPKSSIDIRFEDAFGIYIESSSGGWYEIALPGTLHIKK
jgi:hypothetical protein